MIAVLTGPDVLPRAPARPAEAQPKPASARFPARVAAGDWHATRHGRGKVWDQLTRPPFVMEVASTQGTRARGLARLLDWLEDQPGRTWQERWLASGAEAAGAGWTQLPIRWLRDRGQRSQWLRAELASALGVAISADLIRPSLSWLVSGLAGKGALVRDLARTRDPEGFTRLRELCAREPGISKAAGDYALRRTSLIIAAKGGRTADITVGDVLELLDAEAGAHAAPTRDGAVFYRLLHQIANFGEQAPARLREFRTPGQLTPDELIDRYHLACGPVRDLLVDYLRERQPALDYKSLKDLSYYLGKQFWQDLEHHHPGIDSLHLPREVADAWKQRQRTKPKTITARTGEKTVIAVERISYRQCLTPVRAFYLDLSQWAIEDPGRWAPWVTPCPVGQEEIGQRKFERRRKARMDARTRERLPVLPILARTVDDRRKAARTLLETARQTQPGDTFTAGGQTLTRSVIKTTTEKVWADDPASGKRRDLGLEEDHAFWAWAAVEVLRLTGIRMEELLEISHHSLIQYRLPTTGELVPLLQIVPSKTDEERLLVVSPELADVLSAIICRARDHSRRSASGPRLRPVRMRLAAAVTCPVPAPLQDREPCDQRRLPARHAQRRSRPHRARRSRRRPAPALHPARLPQDLHHRRHHERPAAAHRTDHRGSPGSERDHGLQGRLSRRGDPGPPGIPGPPPVPAAGRGIPRPDRRGMGRVPRSFRTPQGRHRHLRPRVRDPMHARAQLPALQHALA